MKLILIVLTCSLPLSSSQQVSKLELVCQKWRQVGIGRFGKPYKPVDRSMSETILIKNNGSFEKEINGNLKIKGQWKFSDDSTKMAFVVREMNGVPFPGLSLAETTPTDSIIRLTNDTLIYGSLGFYGKQGIYGHDDCYYVREK